MDDRVPIPLIGGLLSFEVGTDHAIGTVGVGDVTLTRLFLRLQTTSTSGDVDLELRDATTALASATITAGTFSVEAALSPVVVVTGGTGLFLRVTAGGTGAMSVGGWYGVSAGAAISAALTSLTRVKTFLGIPVADTSADARLTELIAVVSTQIQNWLRRDIVQSAETAELYDHGGMSDRLVLRNWPVAASPVPTATIDGTAVAGADLAIEDAAAGILVYQPDGNASEWPPGRRHIAVDYTHGFAAVPEDIAEAATMQTAWLWKRRKNLGERTAALDETGLGQTFLVDDSPSEYRAMLLPYRSTVLMMS